MIQQSTNYTFTFIMILSSDHTSPATGKTVTVNISKAGGAFGAAAGTVSELSLGWYKCALTNVDTNTLGDLSINCTASACDNMDAREQIVLFNPLATIQAGVDAALDATNTELASIPTLTASLRDRVKFLFQYFKNKRTVTSAQETLFKDDSSTTLGSATVADDGTTFTHGKIG